MLEKIHYLFQTEYRDKHPVSSDILYKSVLQRVIYQDFGSSLSGLDRANLLCINHIL